MNLLLDTLPDYVTIDGREYPFDADFRTFIIMEKILDDKTKDNRQRVLDLIDLFYTDEQPPDPQAAIEEILTMYRCGGPPEPPRKARKNGNIEIGQKPVFDYEYDAPYIYGAFLAQYGIDLNDIEFLHWWKFQALFRSLNSSNKIVEIISYRSTELGKIKDKAERNRIARLQRIYALPEKLTVEERIAMAGAAFGGAF